MKVVDHGGRRRWRPAGILLKMSVWTSVWAGRVKGRLFVEISVNAL